MNESIPESEVIATLPWETRQATQPMDDTQGQSLWQEFFQPIWTLLCDTCLILFRDSFAHSWRSLTQLFNAEKQQQTTFQSPASWPNRPISANTMDAFDALTAQSAQGSVTVQTKPSLAIDTHLDLHKVHPHSTAARETSAVLGIQPIQQSTEQNNTNAVPLNPWLHSIKKQQCVLPLPKYSKEALKAREIARKKKQAHAKLFGTASPNDTSRGLDDIYTRPVGDLFAGEPELAKIQHTSVANWKKSSRTETSRAVPTTTSKTKSIKPQTQDDHLLIPSDPYEPDALFKNSRSHQNRIKQEKLEIALKDFEELQASVYNRAKTSATEAVKTISPTPYVAKPSDTSAEPDYSEFIPGVFDGKLTEKPRHQKPHASKPVAAKPSTPPVVSPSKPVLTPSEPSGISYSGSLLVAKARAARIDFKRQMPLYQEMKDEISGTDHMFRNHQILRNSMNSLTENYFKKAAEEEAQHEQHHFL